MIEVATGLVTLIADQPDPGNTFCGSPTWSSDGKRILFDAMRTEEVQRAHLKSIEVIAGKLTVTDSASAIARLLPPAATGSRSCSIRAAYRVPSPAYG